MDVERLLQIASAADPGLRDIDRDELVELWLQAEALATEMSAAKAKLAEELGVILDSPVTLPDGRVLRATRKVARRGWDRPGLWRTVAEKLGREYVDPASGERVVAVEMAEVERCGFLDLATGRTRVWKHAGVPLDDYCEVVRTPGVEVIK